MDFERKWFAKFESVLDGSTHGPVWLRDDRIAAQIAEGLRYRDGRVYRLDAFSIMANHVHAVFKPLPVTRAISLRRETQSQKMQTKQFALLIFRATKSGNHPALVRIEKVAIGRADVRPRCGERTATQDLLAHEPFVVVFVKL